LAIVGGMLAFASPQPKFFGGTRPPRPPIIAAPGAIGETPDRFRTGSTK